MWRLLQLWLASFWSVISTTKTPRSDALPAGQQKWGYCPARPEGVVYFVRRYSFFMYNIPANCIALFRSITL